MAKELATPQAFFLTSLRLLAATAPASWVKGFTDSQEPRWHVSLLFRVARHGEIPYHCIVARHRPS
jgi:hypothetical protein